MELKTNYQYTYFIHPFVISEGKYEEYILKLLKDKNCNIKFFQKEKDFKIYKYFLPKSREFLFPSFGYNSEEIRKIEKASKEEKAKILSKNTCNIFEYILEKDIQGKIEQKDGIFFDIPKIEIICFNTGICFLAIKTNVEEYEDFNNILNFNYKFRDINNKLIDLENYDNIRIQSDTFKDTKTFQEFINNITGSNVETDKLNMDIERFLTYSYICIDEEAWNNENGFEKIEHQYIKYVNILPVDSSRDYEYEKIETFSKWKYAKLGLNKLGMMLFSSSNDMNNYTVLQEEYENQYFYTYIFNLYKRIYLKRIELQFNDNTKIKKAREEFINFTKNLWELEITQEETGELLNKKLQDVFEINKIFNEVNNKYDILYKELNIEKERKTTLIMAIILIISLAINIVNFIVLMN